MKPKKTTAPSDSQRDSQDLPVGGVSTEKRSTGEPDSQDLDWKDRFQDFYFQNEKPQVLGLDLEDLQVFIQQEKDKSYQAGFQEAVEKMTRLPVVVVPNEFLGKKPPDYGVQPAILIKHLSSLKPTPDQGSEEEVEFYDDSNSEQLKKESREDLVIMEMLVNRKKRPVK